MAGGLTVQDFASSYQSDPLASVKQGSDYVSGLFDQAAKVNAGQQYNAGNYAGAASTLASRGDIQGSQAVTNFGQQQFQKQHDYLKQAVPLFTQILQQHGPQAVLQAFDHITPELKQALGADDQTIAQYRQMLAQDPQGTLQALGGVSQQEFQFENSNGTTRVFNKQTGQLVGEYQGTKFMVAPQGSNIVQIGGAGAVPQADAPAGAPPPGAASPSPGPGGASPPGADQVPEQLPNGGVPGLVTAMFPSARITSTLRTPAENAAVGGVPNSAHLVADHAADFVPPQGVTLQQAADHINSQNIPGVRAIVEDIGAAHSTGPHVHVQYMPNASAGSPAPQGQGGAHVIYNAPPKPEKPLPPPTKLANDQEVDFYAGLGLQDPASLSRMFTGPEGRAELTQVRTRMSEMAAAAGLSPAEVVAMRAESKSNVVALYSLVKQRAFVESNSETARKAGGYVLSLAPKGGAQGQSPIFNKWRQWIRGEVKGDADVGKFNFAINTLASEYAKVKTGAYGSAGNTDTAQKEAENLLRSYDNLATLKGRIQAMYKEMDFKKQSYADQEGSLRADIAGAMPGGQKPQQPSNSGWSIKPL